MGQAIPACTRLPFSYIQMGKACAGKNLGEKREILRYSFGFKKGI
jgi:hypothetical protein